MKKSFKSKGTTIYAPSENSVQIHSHTSSEGFKHTVKGQSHYFKIDGKPVAYVLDGNGYRTKDEISPAAVRLVMNFFAKGHIPYMGKVSQEEVEKYSS